MPDARHEVRAGADGGDERGEAGRLLGRGDRAGAVDVGHGRRIGLRTGLARRRPGAVRERADAP